ncbi:DUF2157 domain-containing protein [Pontibacter beigongshangensis]|uniref:DUF2157 domain-containing protein n=1 Tax=Pontibacter beigongshangensis TaxID=2574733 RepID=UPI001650502A|nr:DUF2157 domain-containing protein [Pontibacter beigongshangensis]
MIKDLPELVQAGVITQETADRIRAYYTAGAGKPQNRLLLVSGILGALLIGLGIILIIAHNWDDLNRSAKTALAFLPLLIGQLLGGYTLLKKQASVVWREAAATFLFLSVGATISLVSQVYHIPGNLSSFLLTWMLLGLPLVYILASSFASLFYLAGITYYAVETGYGYQWAGRDAYLFWLLLLLALPHYLRLVRNNVAGNFTVFHHWLVPLSVLIAMGTVAGSAGELLFVAYMSLLGIYCIIGSTGSFKTLRFRNNGYLFMGIIGTLGILLTLTFRVFWEEIAREKLLSFSPEMMASLLLGSLALLLLFLKWQRYTFKAISLMEYLFLIFIPIFSIGSYSAILATVLVNLLVLGIGLLTVRAGATKNDLGLLNAGLLIIAALIISRFFDTNISFVLRGLLFVLVGIGFFLANFWMLKKRKAHEI